MIPTNFKTLMMAALLAGMLACTSAYAQTANPSGKPNSGQDDRGGMQGTPGSPGKPDTTSHHKAGGAIVNTGPTGNTGVPGTSGRTGPTGSTGSTGASGPTGSNKRPK